MHEVLEDASLSELPVTRKCVSCGVVASWRHGSYRGPLGLHKSGVRQKYMHVQSCPLYAVHGSQR